MVSLVIDSGILESLLVAKHIKLLIIEKVMVRSIIMYINVYCNILVLHFIIVHFFIFGMFKVHILSSYYGYQRLLQRE